MIGYKIGGFLWMIAVISGALGGAASFEVFAWAGALFILWSWGMS